MSWRILFGLLILLFGVGALLEQLHIIPVNSVGVFALQWWPLVLVLIGVNQLIRRSEQPWASIIVVGIGVSLLAVTLDRQPSSNFLYLYAILLVLFGTTLLLPRRFQRGDITTTKKGKSRVKHQLNEWIFAGGLHYQDYSQQFSGGRIFAIFGDYMLELHEASLNPNGGQMTMFALFGNITVRVPNTMDISFSGVPALGALENTTRQIVGHEPGRPRLQMRGTAICGNIKVTN
jgi:predicted membrane protein